MKKAYSFVFLLLPVFYVQAQEAFREKPFQPEEPAISERMARQRSQQFRMEQNSVASANFDVNFYRCEWDVDPAVRYIKGKVTSYFTITAATNSITYDLHAALTVDSVLFRGNLVSFQHGADNGVTIQLPQMLPVNQRDSVSIFYQGIPVTDGFGSFATSVQDGTPVMWTLSEPYGAKDWWPCKNASADKADSIDILITHPDTYTSSSNGLLTDQWTNSGKITDYWKHRYPIASYLVAFAVTNYVVNTDSVLIGKTLLPMRMYSYPVYSQYFEHATL